MLVETLAAKHDRFTIPHEVRADDREIAGKMAMRADAAAAAALRAAGSDESVVRMTDLQAIQLSTLDQLFRYLCTEMVPLAMGCERHRPSRAPSTGGASENHEEVEVGEVESRNDHEEQENDGTEGARESNTDVTEEDARDLGRKSEAEAPEEAQESLPAEEASSSMASEPAPEDLDDDDDV